MSNKLVTKTRIKMLFIIFISFFVVTNIAPQMFLADSPMINPGFIAGLKNAPQTLTQLPGNLVASIKNLNPFSREAIPSSSPTSTTNELADIKQVTPPPSVIFKAVSKGVYAGEDPTTGQKYIKVDAGTKYRIIGTVTINGKQYPKIEFVE